jgi:hypothetical protein
MEGELTAARIANAICQDVSFTGIYLLVEGRRDVKLYGKFVDDTAVRIKATWGKYKLREVYQLLNNRGIENVVGIRDADFLRIEGNAKFSADYKDAIFPTDCHDAEIMIAYSGVLTDYLRLVAEEDRVAEFEKQAGTTILELIISLIYEIGCLRLANKKHQLGLSFKPEKPEGNRLKVAKFISVPDWKISRSSMINTAWEYSQNRGNQVATREKISQALEIMVAGGHPAKEIVNGHDFSAVLHMVSVTGLKSKNKLLQDPGCVEDLLIAFFDIRRFAATSLYSRVSSGSTTSSPRVVFKAP